MSLLETDFVNIVKHDSKIEPIGEQAPGGLLLPRYEYLKWISDRYDAGERVQDEVIVNYQGIKAVWDHAMQKGDFTYISDDFFDSLAAIEVLIQRERVVEKYVSVFGEEPKPILSLEN